MRSNTVDDEEEMLYGDSNASAASAKDEMGRGSAAALPSGSEGGSGKAEPSHWCMIIRENGVMEVRHAEMPALFSFVTRCALKLFLNPLWSWSLFLSGCVREHYRMLSCPVQSDFIICLLL